MAGLTDRTTGARFRGLVMFLVQCAIVLACVAVTTFAAIQLQQRQLRSATEDQVLAVARSLADLTQVQAAIGTPAADAALQPLADLIEEAAGVDYVVITDADGVRLTHPDPAARGQPVSTDPSAVLAGEDFVGTEEGTLGPTLRAKVPVSRDGDIVGTASVGVLESRIAADQEAWTGQLVPWVLAAFVVGCLGAALVARQAGRRDRRLQAEVAEFAAQRRLTQALRDQTHEFHTRMHSVHGLIESGAPQQAMDYIAELVPVSRGGAIRADIGDPRARTLIATAAQTLADGGGTLHVDPLSSVGRGILTEDDLGVIANLLRNAIEATEGRGTVSLHLRADHAEVEIAVSDDGPGIDPALGRRVFQRGFTTKAASEDGPRGVGLALVHRVASSRDGHVEISRSRAGGAQLTVTMPTRSAAGVPGGDRT